MFQDESGHDGNTAGEIAADSCGVAAHWNTAKHRFLAAFLAIAGRLNRRGIA
jgi:hypothetical protein